MKWIIVITISTFFWITANSQTVHPGGIPGVKVWLQTTAENNSSGLTDIIKNNVIVKNESSEALNFNPAFYFNENTGLSLPLDDLQEGFISVFIVYQPTTPTEKFIYAFNRDTNSSLVLTSHRLADLDAIEYMNFPNPIHQYPQLNTYFHSGKKSQPTNRINSLSIGKKPVNQNLPIDNFSGLISEIIVYDRTLTPQERQQVESYLSLKYGLTLNNNLGPYLDPTGKVLWSINDHQEYVNNIIGIANDSLNQFFQYKSQSTLPGGIFTIAYSKETDIPSHHYTTLRHNNLPLNFHIESKGKIPRLNRTWKVNATSSTSIDLAWNKTKTPTGNNEVLWLLTDHSGKGDFTVGNSTYYPVNDHGNDKLMAVSVPVDYELSGSDAITIAKGPNLFLDLEVINTDCNISKGSIMYKIIGGTPPYEVSFSDDHSFMKKVRVVNDKLNHLEGIPSGILTVSIKDNNGLLYSDNWYINDFIPLKLEIEDQMIIKKDENITLDATITSGDNISYNWYKEGIEVSNQAHIDIETGGIYSLKITKDGCQYFRDILVSERASSIFKEINSFPNPTINGHFNAQVTLDEDVPLTMTITTIDGMVISQQQIASGYQHDIHGFLPATGIFLVTFEAAGELQTLKLIAK